jgi:hypothetical protein
VALKALDMVASRISRVIRLVVTLVSLLITIMLLGTLVI